MGLPPGLSGAGHPAQMAAPGTAGANGQTPPTVGSRLATNRERAIHHEHTKKTGELSARLGAIGVGGRAKADALSQQQTFFGVFVSLWFNGLARG